MNIKEIINRFKEAKDLKTDSSLAKYLGVKPSTISGWTSRNSIDYDLIFEKCENLNLHWLLTGEGEIYPQSDNSSLNVNNKGNISSSQIAGKNNLNIGLPSIGTQKIINSDGSVEISTVAQDKEIQCEVNIEIFKNRIQDLENLIKSQAQTIDIQNEFIINLKNFKNL